MDNQSRIKKLAQDIYLARNGQESDAEGDDLTNLLKQTVSWANQFTREVEKEADWNMVRTNDDETIGAISDAGTISYPLPGGVRKLVVNSQRDLTLRQDGTVISTFKLVSPNQSYDPTDNSVADRATTLQRKIIFSRQLRDTEVGATIVADTIAWFPELTFDDVTLLDMFDENPDMRQLYILGILKNQILPDIVQGGLTPSYSQKYDDYLRKCVAENNASSDADTASRESFSFVGGVGF